MSMSARRGRRGFSLLELVVAVVIIGIIAAIAIPRLSRGSAGAADSALAGSLAVLRSAVDLYSAEHNGAFPTVANIGNALTQYTDHAGAVSATKDATHVFGPYVRQIPPLPVGAKQGCTTVAAADGNGVGWIYTAATGAIRANTTDSEKDWAGKKYSDY
jgi:prepilin-type N-terminal cleavage/methylation domain-containing protein